MRYPDRVDAGRRLAAAVQHLVGQPVVVLGLPRGGVPVAAEVARSLGAPLDVIVVRKLGVPSQPELGMGAIGEDGVRIINHDVVRSASVPDTDLAAVEARERVELQRRAGRFRGTRPRLPLEGKTAVIVDDGLATGSTARAACQVARAQGAYRVVLAVPVAPPGWTTRLGDDADELIAVETPRRFYAIGQFYDDFSQTSDAEVVACLDAAAERAQGAAAAGAPGSAAGDLLPRAEDVEVPVAGAHLEGRLAVPAATSGLVVFAHGSGSSRHSRRNRYVADVMHQAGLATLLLDLLSGTEEHDRARVFDVDLLGGRLVEVGRWLRTHGGLVRLPVGLFGASTGAAAALRAAAEPDLDIAAVVSRGGRPDLAEDRLASVHAPTLLIVGGLDHAVIDLNRRAQGRLGGYSRLVVVPGATHLFEEPGALPRVAELARDWFLLHLSPASEPSRA